MLILIAWRNIWRNKKRSVILLSAIGFGIWAGVFSMGLMNGMYAQMVSTGISTRLGHLQIHTPSFRERPEVTRTIPDGPAVLEQVSRRELVQAVTGRAVISGMASSPQTASAVMVLGIDPAADARVFNVNEQVREGTWFRTDRHNPVVIGAKLAERLDVELGNKVVLQGQAADGSIGAGAFRIAGIFRTPSSTFDEMTVFARREDIQRIFGLDRAIHEIVLRLEVFDDIPSVQQTLRQAYPDLAVETWKELAPELAVTTDLGDQMLYVFMIIILLALVFGITNTMLMGVLERIRELGVLKALGMKGGRMFAMILLETFALSLVGGMVGIAAGAGTIGLFARLGIDLSVVSEGLAEFGMGNIIYPVLAWMSYLHVTGLVILTALLSAVYPGVKAVRLDPVQAIRTY
jgi:ABC-type lipoprotein release transport system permease subunit